MESNRVIAGTIGLFIVICLVGAVLAPMINDWATGERITNEGAGWLRMDYTEVTESSNYSMAVSLAGGTITVTDTNSATQSGADDTIAYASSTLAIWTDSGTIQILGTDPDGNPYHATASASVNVWYNQVLGQIIKIDGSEDAITFATPTWAYLPLANGTYGFFDNGTSVQTEEDKPLAVVGGGFAGVYAYNNLMAYPGITLELQTTQDADGLLNGASWAAPQQDQRQLIPITLDPREPDARIDDPGSSLRAVPTPTYTDGDWGFDLYGTVAKIVSYSGASGDIVVPSTVTTGGVTYDVTQFGKGGWGNTVFDTTISGRLIFSEGNTTINDYCCYGCTGITEVILSSTITSIGQGTFIQTGLTGTFVIPSSVTTLPSSSFLAQAPLTGLVIISNATPGTNTFYNISTLTEVLDLSSVTYSAGQNGLAAGVTVQDNIGDALGYISFVEKGSDPLVPAGAAAVMLAIPVVILGALIVVAATTFIRKE